MARRNAEITRKRIISAAVDIFSNVDFNTATIRDIAKESGISQACIYKYFESKEQILIAVTSETLEKMWGDLIKSLANVKGIKDKLRRMTWYYLNFNEQNPDISWLVYVSTNVRTWRTFQPEWGYSVKTAGFFRQMLKQGQEEGEVREDIDPRVISHLYFGGLRWFICDWLLGDRDWSLVGYADILAKSIFDVIKPDQEKTAVVKCPYIERVIKRTHSPNRNPSKSALH